MWILDGELVFFKRTSSPTRFELPEISEQLIKSVLDVDEPRSSAPTVQAAFDRLVSKTCGSTLQETRMDVCSNDSHLTRRTVGWVTSA